MNMDIEYITDYSEAYRRVIAEIFSYERLNPTGPAVEEWQDVLIPKQHRSIHNIINNGKTVVKASYFNHIMQCLEFQKIICVFYCMPEDPDILMKSTYTRDIQNGTFEYGYRMGKKYGALDIPSTDFFDGYDQGYFVTDADKLKREYTNCMKKVSKGKHLTLEKNIAEIEDIEYQVEYTRHHELKINGIVLAKPRFEGMNDQALEYIISSIESKTSVGDIKLVYPEFNKSLLQVMKDVGLTGVLRELFFLNASRDVVEFINPITATYLKENGREDLLGLDIKNIVQEQKNKRKK
jgi:hypothetical protein